jgi:hypothetical protein
MPLWMQQGMLGFSREAGIIGAGTRAFATSTKLAQAEEQFVVVSTQDLSIKSEVTAATTKGAALQALKEYVAGRPREVGQFQVVPLHELEEV